MLVGMKNQSYLEHQVPPLTPRQEFTYSVIATLRTITYSVITGHQRHLPAPCSEATESPTMELTCESHWSEARERRGDNQDLSDVHPLVSTELFPLQPVVSLKLPYRWSWQ